ncbi:MULTISPECIES: NupC/NupG family nucleoside CNT transporter [Planktothricoides]|uniref:Nucleoside:proton symporter n=1 Tax=Planktothricoides raciborskii FACHB-1370 TaxID=2949576 RepID=A0ABR8EF46_9CYAN|nr:MULTISPECIES: nucleoside transporter C-terminal domain-containing protein [Planktothricoides]KOR34618.1 nucleoside:proton symporter [Planktothricoides sp. SR001]MBD2544365.1 nucleoside:proton symporter [Planktothricoides raciborskii FACHB-1370]MBD2582212.1 nucleoside:proton symporter [Planktothricoides raciborskii FACHB-1261]
MNLTLNLISFLGIFALCFVAWLGSEDRKALPIKVIVWGIALQLVLGLLVFQVPITRNLIANLGDLFNALIDAADTGARFLFGDLIVPKMESVGPGAAGRWITRALQNPYVAVPGDRLGNNFLDFGYIFAFRALPQVVFFSALVSLLYRLGLIQPIVKLCAIVFRATMGISGAESLSGAANIFVGIESVIAVKPFLADMTRSEICAILTSCFGSIASTVLGLYAGYLRGTFPNITAHLMSASFITIPACFVIAKILVPEKEEPKTLGTIPEEPEDDSQEKPSPMDSLIVGALDGVNMATGIAAVLIAIIGLVAILNNMFGSLAGLSQSSFAPWQLIGNLFSVVTLNNIFGVLFFPLTLLTGVSLNPPEIWQASVLIGQRVLQTSIPPYIELARLNSQQLISDRAMLIVSYVLCGFAHIPSYGIFVGGLASLVPSRRNEISSLGWISLWAATLATLMTGCIAGVFFFGDSASILGR